MFDIFKGKPDQKPVPSMAPAKGKQSSRGSVKLGSFTFNVRDYSEKGFLIDPYDKDLLVKGQRFKFDIDVAQGEHSFKGSGEALVVKIVGGALAANFITKPRTG